jgi:hypothetical protein
MPLNMITVRPERSRLVAFARWATAQTPKIATVGLGEFGVPARLFVLAPEEVLVGALVDGHRYVSPSEDAANGLPEPGHQEPAGAELLGVATPDALTPPAEEYELAGFLAGSDAPRGFLPPAPEGLDYAPLEDAPTSEDQDDVPAPDLYGCPLCPRHFETVRGRDTHHRQAHRED